MDASALCYVLPYDWANGGSADVFPGMVSMVLVTWKLVLFYGMGVEFEGKIMSNYSRVVKWQQSVTTGSEYFV